MYYTYNHYINKANRLKENHKFLEAAENYKIALGKAEKMFFDRGRLVKAACKEADCYLVLGLEENDSDIAYQYYAKAGGKYGKIISDKENKKTDFYVDALVGLSCVYNYTEHKLDKEWALLIEQIKEETKKINENIKDDNNIDDTLLHRLLNIYSALIDYYYVAIKADYAFMLEPTILYSALSCYEKYDALFNLANEKNIEVLILINSVNRVKIKVELLIMLASSPRIKNPNMYANQAIELCNSYLNNVSNYKIDIENYIFFKYSIGKGYYELAKYYEKEEKKSDEYMKKAYDELATPLNMESDKPQLGQMIDIGYSMIFTGYCSEEDLEKILGNYKKLLSQYDIGENPKETARYALNVCDACKGIIENYGYLQEAWELGQHLSEEVKMVEEYVQISQRDPFDKFYDYFHQDVKKVMENLSNENNN